MPRSFLPSLIFACLIIVFALLARIGLADRQTVEIMLLVLPVVAISQMVRNRSTCARHGQEA
jgi:hypothetical protein